VHQLRRPGMVELDRHGHGRVPGDREGRQGDRLEPAVVANRVLADLEDTGASARSAPATMACPCSSWTTLKAPDTATVARCRREDVSGRGQGHAAPPRGSGGRA
jgi:hypothetical protein